MSLSQVALVNDIDGWGDHRAFEYWDTRTQSFKTAPGPRTIWAGSADALPNLPLSTASRTSTPSRSRTYSCAKPAGGLGGISLGPVRLGMTRAQARRRFSRSSFRGRAFMDYFCTGANGIRVGYPSPRLLDSLSAAEQRRVRGRVVLILATSRHYTLRGVRPGTRMQAAARRLHLRPPDHVGANAWYRCPDGPVRCVLKVRHGVVQEIGITLPVFGASDREAALFFRSFS